MRTIVLSSSSASRHKQLQSILPEFTTLSPNIDESPLPNEAPEAMVIRLAIEKAKAAQSAHPDALIIGSDQIGLVNGTVLTKPKNHNHAIEQLTACSGQSIQCLTGLCLLDSRHQNIQSTCVTATLHFRSLSQASIIRYLKKDQPYACAGSIQIDKLGISLIKAFDCEDPNSIIGLPLIALTTFLNERGVDIP